MKILNSYIYLLIIALLLISVNSNNIPEYHYKKRKIKRDDDAPTSTIIVATPNNQAEQGKTDNLVPNTIAEPAKETVAIETPTAEVIQPTQSLETPTGSSDNDKNKSSSTTKESSDHTSSSSEPTHDSSKNDNKTSDDSKHDSDNKTNDDSKTNDDNKSSSSGGNSSSDSNNSNSNNNNSSSNTSNNNSSNSSSSSSSSNNSNKKDDDKGLSGGIIAVIVLGGIFALGVVILIFRALLKLCTRKKDDAPLPVLNVVSNTSSTEGLNPQAKMSQEAMIESGQYYNPSQYSSQNNVPVTGTVVGINDQQQYYGQQNGYDNGVDLGNSQYQPGDYQNGYAVNGEYPQQEQVVQPVRQYSSLRRPNANGGMGDVPPEGYDGNAAAAMMNGEITDANQPPRKVIINKSNNTPIEPGTIHKTQFPFNPNMDDELRLNAGDAVEIIEVYDDGWSYGRNMATNEVGVFPISYITGYNDPSNNF